MATIDIEETIRRLTATCLAQGLVIDFLLSHLLSQADQIEREKVSTALRQKSLQTDYLRTSVQSDAVAEITADVTVKMQQELADILERALRGAAAVD